MIAPRVGFWSPILNAAGGTETWHLSLFRELQGQVDNLGLVVLQDSECEPEFADRLREFAPVRSGATAAMELALRVDVLIVWGIAELWRWLPKRLPPKVVYVSHGDGTSLWTKSCAAVAESDIDLYVGVSQSALNSIPSSRREQARVILNGVDLNRIAPTIPYDQQRRAWGIPTDAKVLGFLGRLSEEKNPKALAAAVQWLPKDWYGVVVGDGPDWTDLISDGFARTYGRVKFPGATQDIGSALCAMDILLVPSHEEGFGYTIVEGWAAGVPVISTPVGIAKEHPWYVQPLGIRPTGDAIARAVLQVHGHPNSADRVDRAREFARTHLSDSAFGRNWSHLIHRLAN